MTVIKKGSLKLEKQQTTLMEWKPVDGTQLRINFNSKRVYTNISMLINRNADTGSVEDFKPMFQVSAYDDMSNRTVFSFNQSNALLMSSVFDLFSEDTTIRKYFDKTLASGWFVYQKYIGVAVYTKTFSEKFKVTLTPTVDSKKVPQFKITWFKNDATYDLILTKLEMQAFSKLMFQFVGNCPMFIDMYKNLVYKNNLNAQFEKISSIAGMLGDILAKLNEKALPMPIVTEIDDNTTDDIELPVIDTNIESEIFEKDDYAYTVDKNELRECAEPVLPKENSDIIDIDSEIATDLATKENKDEFCKIVESKTGAEIKKDTAYPENFEISDENFEKMPICSANPELIAKNIEIYTKDTRVLAKIGEKYGISAQAYGSWLGILKYLNKSKLFDQNTVISMLINRGHVGIPVTSVILAASVFASAYEYIKNHPECDPIEISVNAAKSLQLCEVTSCDVYANNDECKSNFNKYYAFMIEILTDSPYSPNSIMKVFKLDRYVSFGKYDFSAIDVKSKSYNFSSNEYEALLRSLVDIYMLLWYANTKYLNNSNFENAELYGTVNESMYKLARSLIINIVSEIDNDGIKKAYAENMIYFKKIVTAFSWEPEIFKEAFIELLAYNAIYGVAKAQRLIEKGFPCLNPNLAS